MNKDMLYLESMRNCLERINEYTVFVLEFDWSCQP